MAANEEKCLKSRSSIQCITINAKNYVRYFKECKLSLNKVTKRLTIRPSGNEEICVAFGRTFIRHNDFLCIDACEIDKNKYAIIFRDAEQCERFLVNANQKKGQFFAYIKISNDDDFIAEIFLSTIAKQFQHDPSLYPLKPIFLELAEYFKQKNGNCNSANVSTNDTVLNEGVPTSGDIFALSAATESNDAILSVDTVLSEVSFESKVQQQVSVSLNDTEILSDTVESNSSANTVLHEAFNGHEELDASNDYSVDNSNEINVVGGNERKRSLRSQPKKNYKFADSNTGYCTSNEPKRRRLKLVSRASLNQSESMLQIPSSRDEEKYPTNFKFFNYIRMGKSRSQLFIFPPNSSGKCYEYFYDYRKNRFTCCGCNNGKRKHAIVKENSDGNNIVECLRTDHRCKLREFKPEKYKTDLIIKKPNYKKITDSVMIFGKKETRKFLLLFTSVDQKQFYKLQWDNGQNLYACMECTMSKKSYVQACVRRDEDGNEFVYVRNQKHACSNMKYLYAESDQPTEEELTTFKAPERQWIKRYKSEKAGATFVKRRFRKRIKIQPRKPRTRSTQPKTDVPNQSNISKYLQKPNSSNVVQSIIESLKQSIEKSTLSQTQSSDNKSKIIRPSMYEFFTKAWRGKNIKKLAVFVSDDKKMCYEYTWHSTHKAYVCSACIYRHHKHVSAKVIQNENGEECIQLGANDHKCYLKPFLR